MKNKTLDELFGNPLKQVDDLVKEAKKISKKKKEKKFISYIPVCPVCGKVDPKPNHSCVEYLDKQQYEDNQW